MITATLLLCVIHASLVVLATTLLRASISSRFAASRTAVGAAGIAAMLLVTVLTFVPLPSIWPQFDQQATSRTPISVSNSSVSEVTTAPPVHSESATNVTGELAGHTPHLSQWLRKIGVGIQTATVVVESSSRGWEEILIALLICGIGICAMRLLLSIWHLRQLYRASQPIADDRVINTVGELMLRCQNRRSVDVRQSDSLASAGTFGVLKPVILLPADWPTWSADELAAVLAHEVAHIARRDYLQRLLAHVGIAIHFYHPLVRLLAHKLAVDQEFAADTLARDIAGHEKSYVRGLALLALRYHNSFPEGRSWSNVSIMPKSSDFLAKRLEMLRSKDGSANRRRGRLVSCCASASLMFIALVVTLLRSPTASAEKPAEESAKQEAKDSVRTALRTDTVKADNATPAGEPSQALFTRGDFDISQIPNAEKGAYVIRVADMLRNSEWQPQIDRLEEYLSESLSNWAEGLDQGKKPANDAKRKTKVKATLRGVEWIAGSTCLIVRMSKNRDGSLAKDEDGHETSQVMLGTENRVIVRTTVPGNWEQEILDHVPGATLETFEGQNYVQLPVIPAFGPSPCRLRFPDDRTIIGSTGMGAKPQDNAKSLKAFFRDHRAQQPYAWADAWKAVDGGVITAITDFSASGYAELTPEKRAECPAYAKPLVEKAKYYAVGLDLTDNAKLAGIQARATGTEASAVPELHLASMILMSKWPEMFVDNQDMNFEKYHKRILQFFAGIQVRSSKGGDGPHYIHARAEAPLEEHEAMSLLMSMQN